MARRWNKLEEGIKRKELIRLYIQENKSIGEIAIILKIAQSSVYDRLIRLGIQPDRSLKIGFNNKRRDITIPDKYSEMLSEFIGILLGDGHINPTQVTVTLGSKELRYVYYVANLIKNIFSIEPKIVKSKNGYFVVYFGSTEAVRWLLKMGLVFNKVKKQVDVPSWILTQKEYMDSFLRGFFDSDGSIYKLRFGIQIAFINRSLPILQSIRYILILLGFFPSQISKFRVYLTRKEDVKKFFKLIKPSNNRHLERFLFLTKHSI